MLSEFSNQLEVILYKLTKNFYFSLGVLISIWLIHLVNCVFKYRFNRFGIVVRSWRGLFGIFFAPFLHGNWNHLFFNSIPLFGLVDLLILRSFKLFYYLTIWVVVSSGIMIWLFGKRGIHIGASGLIMGYFGYLISEFYFCRSMQNIILLVLVVYYFGGLLFSIIPQKKGVSWEGHLFGLLSGISFAYWLYR